MLALAEVTRDDYVIDLGAGDGKIPIVAARDFGASALGIEYDAGLARLAQCLVEVEGVGRRARIIQGDIFVEDFSAASVLTLFLLPRLNRCIRHRILAMQPGTRVVSHLFRMGDWRHDDMVQFEQRAAYLWIVPARVGGIWDFRDARGNRMFTTEIAQHYQEIAGEALVDADRLPLARAELRGDRIAFRYLDRRGQTVAFSGSVSGERMAGTLETPGASAPPLTGTLREARTPATWAAMVPGCETLYPQ